ncbi:porin [Paraburkholderia sediminicola]|uniref:porin n=1 Tax=Paraburkholderia sediminicola TaxID=458836 RepID=UPI0038BBD764
MKYSIFGATIALAMVSSLANAQNSVTLYGLLDTGFTYVSNVGGKSLAALADGVNLSNRWGMLGNEDLGGGNRALFVLENGFSLNTGALQQGGRMFGRQAYVGLSNELGTVTLGNQYDFMFDYLTQFSAGGYASGYGLHIGDFDREAGARLQNAVKLKSASWGGWQVGAMYSFGNVSGSLKADSAWSAGVKYDGGPFSMAGVYTRINNPHDTAALDPYSQAGVLTFLCQTVAKSEPATGTVTDLYPYGTPFSVDSQSIAGIGASYRLANLTLTGNVTATTFKGYGTSETLWVYEGGATYLITPAMVAIASYAYQKMGSSHWNQPTIGMYYYLSKRTSLYANASFQAATNAYATQGEGYFFSPSSSRYQTTARIAITHKF